MRKIVAVILGFVAFGVATFGVAHWLASRSDAYAAAVRYVQSSNELVARVGQVKSTTLSWFDHASVEQLEIDGKLSGNAEFTILVEGASGSLAVSTQLTRDERGWQVTSAMVDHNVSK